MLNIQLNDILMIYGSKCIQRFKSPFHFHPTAICIGESQEEKTGEARGSQKKEKTRDCGSKREEQHERKGGEIREKELMDFLSE